MKHVTCPTTVVNAPLDIVWALLTEPAGWKEFFDIRISRVEPPGSAVVGQRIYAESGVQFLHLSVRLEYTEIDVAQRKIGLTVRLPLGITVLEDLHCSAVGAAQCRVTYQCDFGIPSGWRGTLARVLLRREFEVGPADSLTRLARAAEFRFARSPS